MTLKNSLEVYPKAFATVIIRNQAINILESYSRIKVASKMTNHDINVGAATFLSFEPPCKSSD